jgi:hypothetical protein
MADKGWGLEEARGLIAVLQTEVRPFGYHITLGGSVLNTGRSVKDLDLYFIPLDNDKAAPPVLGKLLDWLAVHFGPSKAIGNNHNYGNPTGVYAHKLEFGFLDRRVDVFIVGEGIC